MFYFTVITIFILSFFKERKDVKGGIHDGRKDKKVIVVLGNFLTKYDRGGPKGTWMRLVRIRVCQVTLTGFM